MEPFVEFTSYMVPINRENVDTDAILPKQYMAMITREGFGAYLFDSWRYQEPGRPGMDNTGRTPNPQFPLNMPVFEGAQILVSRKNFGCGSSREHAVWALKQHGIRAIIAPSFADIFYGNCMRNGILPVRLSNQVVDDLFLRISEQGRVYAHIDLEHQQVLLRDIDSDVEATLAFSIDERHKSALLLGMDEIDLILMQNRDALEAMQARRFTEEAWLNKK
jgi:3-isopropylmalate/(R)-2-methylmalate dehydratase small subunit